jgi:hypothetical protein
MRYGKAFAIGSALCVAGMTRAASAAVIAQFNFDSVTSGTTFTDLSTNGHTAAYNNTVALQNADPFDHAGAESQDRSVVQSGTARASLNNTSGININNAGANSFTIEGWVNLSSLPTANAYLVELKANSTSDPSQNPTDIYLGINSSGNAIVYFNSRSGTPQNITGSSTLQSGQWAHLAFTYHLGATTATTAGILYVNGAQEGTPFNYRRQLPAGLSAVYIGGDSGATSTIQGAIDDVLFANTAYALGNANTPNTIMYDYTHSFSAVPEPASVAVLALGGLLLIRKRRRA